MTRRTGRLPAAERIVALRGEPTASHRGARPPTRTLRRGAIATALAACALFGAPADVAARPADDGAGAALTPGPAKDLVAQLGGTDAAARAAATEAIVKIGAAAVPDLVAALADPNLREQVAGVITRMGPVAKDAVPALIPHLRGAPTAWRPAVSRALGSIGADAAAATGVLASIVNAPKAPDRREAVVAIGRIVADAGRKAPRTTPPGAVDRAVSAGCAWLLRHQEKDGRWSSEKFGSRCAEGTPCGGPGGFEYDVGVTGLATLALLAADGRGDARTDAGAQERRRAGVESALAWLRSQQDKDGLLGSRKPTHATYNHGCAGLAIADAYLRTRREDLRAPLERATQFIASIRNEFFGAWRYRLARVGDADTSVTTWMVKVLLTAEDAGIAIDPAAVPGGLAYIDSMTDPETGMTGYQQRGGPSARTSEMQRKFPSSLVRGLVGCSLWARLATGRSSATDPLVPMQTRHLMDYPPTWDAKGEAVDYYYWLHGSAAMRLVGGRDAAAWRTSLLAALLPHQVAPGTTCDAGSWPAADAWGVEAGRVYSTAAALLALEDVIDDPAARPSVPGAHKMAVDVLVRTSQDPDASLRAAIGRALNAVHGVYR